MKIYLDIDDTLLNNDIFNTRPANHLKEFLEYMLNNHEVYWLTTHCNGDPTVPVQYLSWYVDSDTVGLLMRIRPTRWNIIKSEALDMNSEFLWFDDVLSWGDEEALKINNKLCSFVKVDLDKNPDSLKDYIKTK